MKPNAQQKGWRGVERALVEASQLLVSSTEVDLRKVLRILGEAIGAECAHLVMAPGEEGPLPGVALPFGSVVLWHHDGEAGERRWLAEAGRLDGPASRLPGRRASGPTSRRLAPGLAELTIPLLSKQERFIGYLSIEHTTLPEQVLREHGRILSVFGDLLASYLGRIAAEGARRESEERWRKLVKFHPDPILVTVEGAVLYANDASARLLGAREPAELLTYTLRDFLPAERSGEVERHLARQVLDEATAPFEHAIIRLDGEERIVESLSAAITFRGHPALQTVLRDVTERRREEEGYRTFVQTISEGIWRIDLERPLPLAARPHLQARHVLEHGRLAECNAMMARLLGVEAPEAVLGRRISVILPWLEPRRLRAFAEAGYRLHSYELSIQRRGAPARHFTISAVGQVERGALVCIWGSCSDITERVEMERRMVAVLEEQQERIGRDLHDGVGQLLTGIRMLSENLASRHFSPEDEGHATALKVRTFAEQASEQVRNICRGLAPPQLYQEGLLAALEGLASNVDALGTVSCIFTHDGATDVEERAPKLQLYRIAQEAVNNALRHARPAHIRIRLRTEEEQVVLEIEDDGAGFDLEQRAERSLGLYSMQRRASSIRAALSITSRPGEGTAVRVVLHAEHEGPIAP